MAFTWPELWKVGSEEKMRGVGAAGASHMAPCKLDEGAWLPFCHPTAWNVDVKAGTVATILDHEDKGHSWGGRG